MFSFFNEFSIQVCESSIYLSINPPQRPISRQSLFRKCPRSTRSVEESCFDSDVTRTGMKKNDFEYDMYLLASSPPGFEFINLSRASDFHGSIRSCGELSLKGPSQEQPEVDQTNDEDEYFDSNDDVCLHDNDVRISKWESVYSDDERSRSSSTESSEGSSKSFESSLEKKCLLSPTSPKRVTFADDVGKELTQVKLFTERPDIPSEANSRVIARHAPTTSFAPPWTTTSPFSSLLADRMSPQKPTLAPKFIQPASNYSTFLEKLETNCVCLEYVNCSSDVVCSITGNIKVKSLSFEKQVFVRYTFDDWKSSFDIEAMYVQSVTGPFNTFSFQIYLPSVNELPNRVEFAICYRCSENREFWDNNSGSNYILAVSDSRSMGDDSVTSFCKKQHRQKCLEDLMNGVFEEKYKGAVLVIMYNHHLC